MKQARHQAINRKKVVKALKRIFVGHWKCELRLWLVRRQKKSQAESSLLELRHRMKEFVDTRDTRVFHRAVVFIMSISKEAQENQVKPNLAVVVSLLNLLFDVFRTERRAIADFLHVAPSSSLFEPVVKTYYRRVKRYDKKFYELLNRYSESRVLTEEYRQEWENIHKNCIALAYKLCVHFKVESK